MKTKILCFQQNWKYFLKETIKKMKGSLKVETKYLQAIYMKWACNRIIKHS